MKLTQPQVILLANLQSGRHLTRVRGRHSYVWELAYAAYNKNPKPVTVYVLAQLQFIIDGPTGEVTITDLGRRALDARDKPKRERV